MKTIFEHDFSAGITMSSEFKTSEMIPMNLYVVLIQLLSGDDNFKVRNSAEES